MELTQASPASMEQEDASVAEMDEDCLYSAPDGALEFSKALADLSYEDALRIRRKLEADLAAELNGDASVRPDSQTSISFGP